MRLIKVLMSGVTRKPVFRVFNQVRYIPDWAATEDDRGFEILAL